MNKLGFQQLVLKCLDKEVDKGSLLLSYPKALLSDKEKKWVEWIDDYQKASRSSGTNERAYPSIERFCDKWNIPPQNLESWNFHSLYEEVKDNMESEFWDMAIVEHKNENTANKRHPFAGWNVKQKELQKEIIFPHSNILYLNDLDRTAYKDKVHYSQFYIPPLDRAFGGMSPTDVVGIVGPTNGGKTFLLTLMMHLQILHSKNILMIGGEALPLEIGMKIDGLISGFEHQDFRTAYNDSLIEKSKNAQRIMNEYNSHVYLSNRINKIHELDNICNSLLHRPDVIMIDGFNLISGTSWEDIIRVTAELKDWAVTNSIPIIFNTQASRSAYDRTKLASLDDVAGGLGFAQSCDLMFSVVGTTANFEDVFDVPVLVTQNIKDRVGTKVGTSCAINYYNQTVNAFPIPMSNKVGNPLEYLTMALAEDSTASRISVDKNGKLRKSGYNYAKSEEIGTQMSNTLVNGMNSDKVKIEF